MSAAAASAAGGPGSSIMDFLHKEGVLVTPGESSVGAAFGSGGGMAREDQERYLLSLLSFGLDRVAAEPERLAAESRVNKKETETHAVENYGAFLESAVCVRNVREELESSGGLLHGLAARVPELTSSIQGVSDRAKEIERERTDVTTTLKQHSQLLEILEIPQLLDTAVRNEYYEEALDLAAFARKLEARHADVHLTKDLVDAVDACEQQLMQQLLAKLQSNIQLPVCLHVIGLLRRLGKHTDDELRFTFLQCRDTFLQTAVDKAARGEGGGRGGGSGAIGTYAMLCKFTDLIRTHMFEIVTQYRAIFLDFNSAQEDSASSGDGGLMYAWANHRLVHYLDSLEKGLPHLKEGSQIVSVLEKAMYGGAYLGREGLDFRGALTPLFEARVMSLLGQGLKVAQGAFEGALTSQRTSAMPPALKARYDEAAKGEGFQPPSSLLDHPPLAVLCNKVSEVLNEVRECAILSIKARAHSAVEGCIQRCANSLAVAWVQEEASLGEKERAHVLASMRCMGESLAPYVAQCLQLVFSTAKPELDVARCCGCLEKQLAIEEEAQRERERKEEEERVREQEEQERRARAAEIARLKAEQEVESAKRKVEEVERQKREAASAPAGDVGANAGNGGGGASGAGAYADEAQAPQEKVTEKVAENDP